MVEGILPTEIVKDINLDVSTPKVHENLIVEIGTLNDIDDIDKYLRGYALDVAFDFSNRFYIGDLEPVQNNTSTGAKFEYARKYDLFVSELKKERLQEDLSWLVTSEHLPKELEEKMKEFYGVCKEKFTSENDIGTTWKELQSQWEGFIKPLVKNACENGNTKKDYDYFKEKKLELTKVNEKGLRVPGGFPDMLKQIF